MKFNFFFLFLGKRQKLDVKPIDPEKLKKIREKRLNENEMAKLLKEIVIYLIYLFFLLFLTQQNRNSNAFYINQNLKNMFLTYDSQSNEKVVILNIKRLS